VVVEKKGAAVKKHSVALVVASLIALFDAAGCVRWPGSKVILSDKVMLDGVPTTVTPRGAGSGVVLKRASFKDDVVSVEVTNTTTEDSTLALYFRMQNGFFLVLIDPDTDLTILPSGQGSVGTQGHGIRGQGKARVNYTVRRSVPLSYALSGKGPLYVFAVKGTSDSPGIFPAGAVIDGTCNAVSDVIELQYVF
jgi:hypothetical protein